MKITEDHIDCFEDNPRGYWFKRKLYGRGWMPTRLHGWAVIIIFIIITVFLISRISESLEVLVKELLVPFFLLTLGLIYVSYAKGEKLRWHWGRRNLD